MSRAALDIPEQTESELRSELDSIRSRMILWRRLNELYTRKDGEVPLVQTTLERWVLHDQYADTAHHRSVEAPLRRELYAELGKFDEECGAVDHITDQMRADFDSAVAHLAQNWMVLANQHPAADFSAKELEWAQEDPAHAASWLWEGPVPPPRLGPLRNALEARLEALCAVLGEPTSDDERAHTTVAAKTPDSPSPETARHSEVIAAPTQKRKHVAVDGGVAASRPKRTRSAKAVYDDRDYVEEDDDGNDHDGALARYARGEPSPLIARRIEESGLQPGAVAQIPCDQCAIAKTECKLRFKANTGLPGACQRCHSKNSKCSGGDWRGQSSLVERRAAEAAAADKTGVEELRREVAALRESVQKLTSQMDSQNVLLVEQNRQLHQMGSMMEALLGMARSQQGHIGTK